MIRTRIFITTKDVMCLTGWSDKSARKDLARCRLFHSKQKGEMITILEYCLYKKISPDDIYQRLND